MKKFLLIILSALLSFFMFLRISQAGECIYLDTSEDGTNIYYDPSSVEYSEAHYYGNEGIGIVFLIAYEGSCSSQAVDFVMEIFCKKREVCYDFDPLDCEPINPRSPLDTIRIKYCR